MEKTEFVVGLGLMFFGTGLQQAGLTGHLVGWGLMVIGAILCVYGCRDWLFSSSPVSVEEWSVNNALNLKITSKRKDIFRNELTLVSLQWWDPHRGQFMPMSTEEKPPFVLLGNEVNLPRGVPRMFQLLEFKDKRGPYTILGAFSDGAKRIPLPNWGTWKYVMELKWAGSDGLKIVKCINWEMDSLPRFCKCLK
jgi:hypothetical protein